MNDPDKNNKPSQQINEATRIITSILGVVLAISGMTHGLYEILQGNTYTSGLIIQAIGPEFQRWENGDEAFTLIPNFLFTGIAAICVGIIIIIWAVGFVHKKQGPIILLSLFALLILVGGGLGFIPFILLTWLYSIRIHKPLNAWRKILHGTIKKLLANIWLILLIATSSFFIIGLLISAFGIPGITDHDTILAVCWSSLFLSLILLNVTYIAGFAYDIENTQ